MADNTPIEWADATCNAINGCSLASPGCIRCYAMKLAGTRMKNHPSRAGLTIDTKNGPVWNGEVRLWEPALQPPLKWRRPRVIFWNAHGDTFHPDVPAAWIDKIFAVAALTPQHRHLILTKRPDRMRAYMDDIMGMDPDSRDSRFEKPAFELTQAPCVIGCLEELDWPLPNVWLGTSIEDRTRMLERAGDLHNTYAAGRFWSAEPLIGDLGEIPPCYLPDGVIVGGESGPGSRPMHPDWVRNLRDQCAAAGVDFHFKQWGDWLPVGWEHSASKIHLTRAGRIVPKAEAHRNRDFPGVGLIEIERVGKKAAGRYLDGVTHDALPWRRAA